MSITSVLSEIAEKYKHKTSIEFENRKITFSALNQRANSIAHDLCTREIRKGDRVAHFTPTSPELIYSYLGNFKNGSIIVPVNPQFKEHEVLHILSDSGAKAIVTDEERLPLTKSIQKQLPALEHIILLEGKSNGTSKLQQMSSPEFQTDFSFAGMTTGEEDIAAIFYTSGTTGKPKGAALSHRNIISNLKALKEVWEWSEKDILLHTLPLYHVHGFAIALLGSLFTGNKIILKKKFDAEDVLKTISEKKITLFMGVPTMYFKMLEVENNKRYDLSSMRLFISGSAPLSKEVFHRFKGTFGFEILERAGMTETLMNFSDPVAGNRIPGSVGLPLPGVEVKILDDQYNELPRGREGEIALKGQNVFSGYWNNAAATEKAFHDGWFLSGDIGKIDADGYVYILSRKKDVIKSGGILIFPKEIEDVIEQMRKVKECAVIGVPDETFGESVKACIVADDYSLTSAEVISYCKSQLASFKKPRHIEFFSELPKNSMGKILKEELRRMHHSKG